MARAAGRGMSVTRPHGDSASYDVGVEHNGRYVRVQLSGVNYLSLAEVQVFGQ